MQGYLTHKKRGTSLIRTFFLYRGTSLTRKRSTLGPYRKPMPRVLGGAQGGWRFLQ